MIRPRKHFKNLTRYPQDWITRSDKLRLDFNELVPHFNKEAFEEILSQLQPWMFSAYPEVNQVYQNLAVSLRVSVDHLVLTSGSDGGIRQTIQVFCDPGDAIMISHPTFGMYWVYSQIFNLECIKIHYHEDFSIDIQEFVVGITDKTKILAIANPNGAIGCVMQDSDLEYIIKTASENGTIVLLDETYLDYHEDHWTKRVDDFDNLVLIRSFSKAGGIAGLRFGYLLTNPTVKEWIVKANPYMEINSTAALVGNYLIKNPQVIRKSVNETKEGRAYFVEALREMGFEVYCGEINFVLVKFGNRKLNIYREFEKRKIIVMDQSNKELLREYTRITAGPKSYMKIVIDAINEAMK